MGGNILKRIATSIIILSAAGIIIFLMPEWAFCILVTLFISFALYEFFTIVEKKGIFVYKYFGIIIGSIIPIATYLRLGDNYATLEPFFIVIACLFTFVLQFIRREEAR